MCHLFHSHALNSGLVIPAGCQCWMTPCIISHPAEPSVLLPSRSNTIKPYQGHTESQNYFLILHFVFRVPVHHQPLWWEWCATLSAVPSGCKVWPMSQSSIQTVKHWDIIKSIRDALNHGNKRKWGRGWLFLALHSCRAAPRLQQFKEHRCCPYLLPACATFKPRQWLSVCYISPL